MPSAASAASVTERRSFSRPRPIAAIESSSTTLASRTALSGSSTNADCTPNHRSRTVAAYSASSSGWTSGRAAGVAPSRPPFSPDRPPLAGRPAGTRPAVLLSVLLVLLAVVPLPNVGFVLPAPVVVAPVLDPVGGVVELGVLVVLDDEPEPVGVVLLAGVPDVRGAGVAGGVVRALSPLRSLVSTSDCTRDSCPLLR
ncbi:hypothetical protein SAMN05443668_101414 [Cryptosporangium aurantiacum]|uniref:Uncharacterized protein n=1 Tax=Cryptosporangium aurantiacum TaxID=134849 RepID=A0A1M7I777_9ACTN|nr:hypothetical protein SAMN05443668_101414 [Cryptosporangium aurantiacum]